MRGGVPAGGGGSAPGPGGGGRIGMVGGFGGSAGGVGGRRGGLGLVVLSPVRGSFFVAGLVTVGVLGAVADRDGVDMSTGSGGTVTGVFAAVDVDGGAGGAGGGCSGDGGGAGVDELTDVESAGVNSRSTG